MEPTDRVKKESLDDEKKKYTLSEVDTRTSHVDERLNSREKEGFLAWRSRKDLRPERVAVNTDWQHEPLQQGGVSRVPVLSTLAFIVSLLIVGAVSWFAWSTLTAGNPAPQATANLAVSGKKTIVSGDTLELQIAIENELPIPLELAELVVTYPEGSFAAADPTTPARTERLRLGTISASSVRRGAVRAILFGTSGQEKSIHLALEYRVAGGSIIYQSIADHAVTITSNTFAIAADMLTEVISGQSSDIIISITSQAKNTVSNIALTVENPFGFTAKEMSPEPQDSLESALKGTAYVWQLGTFAPGETKKVYIRGETVGEEGDVRLFNVTVASTADASGQPATRFATDELSFKVTKPFLYTDVRIDGKKPSEFAFTPGQAAKVSVSWENTLRVPLTNVSLGVNVGGDALKKTGIKVTRGFYRSTDSQVLWDAQTKPETFKVVPPGAKGVEEFQLLTLDEVTLAEFTNPAVTFTVRASGKRESEANVPESVEAVRSYSVPVLTKATFLAEAKYFTSPFPQSGPLPPRVDTETVYAVEWKVASTSSRVTNGVITATLPPNVRYRNIRTPIAENLVYDDTTRTVTWYVGTVDKSTTATNDGHKVVTFAVGLVPSASQLREEPDLVTNQVFRGVDSFTKQELEIAAEPLNTILTEEGFDERFSPVVE